MPRECLVQLLTVLALVVAILDMRFGHRFPWIRNYLIFLLIAVGLTHLTIAFNLYGSSLAI